MANTVITVDGQAGVGKTTAARLLSSRLGMEIMDSGMFYRAVAWRMTTEGFVAPMSAERLINCCRDIELGLDPQHLKVTVAGREVSVRELNDRRVSALAGVVAQVQSVRESVIAMERRVAARCEKLMVVGRDSGSVVFTDAQVRFVLVADLDVRRRRRYEQLVAAGEKVTLAGIQTDLETRDAFDSHHWASLRTQPRTNWMDVSRMDLGQLVQAMYETVVGHIFREWA